MGRSLNAVSLPRKAVEVSATQGEIYVPFGGSRADEASFHYVDEKTDALTFYGPIFAVRGLVMSDIEIRLVRYIVHTEGETSARAYLTSGGDWSTQRDKAHRFETEEAAKLAVATHEFAIGYETLNEPPWVA